MKTFKRVVGTVCEHPYFFCGFREGKLPLGEVLELQKHVFNSQPNHSTRLCTLLRTSQPHELLNWKHATAGVQNLKRIGKLIIYIWKMLENQNNGQLQPRFSTLSRLQTVSGVVSACSAGSKKVIYNFLYISNN